MTTTNDKTASTLIDAVSGRGRKTGEVSMNAMSSEGGS